MMQSAAIIPTILLLGYSMQPIAQHTAETNARWTEEGSMASAHEDGAHKADSKQLARLERARTAALEFCHHFGFPQNYIDRIKGNPIQKPLVIERNGKPVEVFRWLGHGRGESYVQVELGTKTDEITVYGALSDREFGPWSP